MYLNSNLLYRAFFVEASRKELQRDTNAWTMEIVKLVLPQETCVVIVDFKSVSKLECQQKVIWYKITFEYNVKVCFF